MVGYNVQAAVDTTNHLIVAHEVTNVGTYKSQLANMANWSSCAILLRTGPTKAAGVDRKSSFEFSERRYSRYGKSCFGGGAHCIEQAARAIAGRLIPQLLHRTLLSLFGRDRRPGQSGGPLSRGAHGRG